MIGGIDRRVLVSVVVIVVVLGGYGAVGYNPAPEAPSDRPYRLPGSLEAAWETGASSFVVTEAVYTGEGETAETLFYRARYAYTGSALRLQVRWSNGTERQDVYRVAERAYAREFYANESRFRSRLEQTPDAEVALVNESAHVFYTIEDRGGAELQNVTGISLALTTLESVPVESTGSTTDQGRDVEVYAPTTGWARTAGSGPGDDSGSVYVRSAAGRVLVDPASRLPRRVDVTVTFVRAGSWAEAVLNQPSTVRSQYHLNTTAAPDDVAPAWLDRVRNRTSNQEGQ